MIIFFLVFLVGNFCLISPNGLLIIASVIFTKIWGPFWGFCYIFVWNFFTQHLVHLIVLAMARHFSSDRTKRRMIRFKKFFILNHAIAEEGTYVHFVLRCSFMVPHPVLTYALAVTDITIEQFIKGNHSCLPLSLLFINLGIAGEELT